MTKTLSATSKINAVLATLLLSICALLSIIGGCTVRDLQPNMSIDFVNGQTIYDGTEQYFYQVEEGEIGELEIRILRESGSVSIYVFRTEALDQYSYRGTDMPTSEFIVTLPKAGEYTVCIEAKKFVGSFCVELLEE